jgi:sugar phosphate isomerase/epimerase
LILLSLLHLPEERTMNENTTRRQFLKTSGALGIGLGVMARCRPLLAAGELLTKTKGAPHAEAIGWHLGCASYSFRLFTLFEAIEKTASLGLKYIDLSVGQKLGGKFGDVTVQPGMAKEYGIALKKKLADHGLTPANYASMEYPKSEAEWRKFFVWLNELGIDTFVTEPAEEDVPMIDKLCNEYRMKVAIHNHPKPSHYWNPETVLRVVKNCSHRVGACGDTGHWKRSGFDPVQCMKKLEGRLITFHFKDLVKEGNGYHDVPWGTGECNVRGMLEEAWRQQLKAVFSFEYEYHWENSLPEIAKSAEYFDRVAAEIATQSAPATRRRRRPRTQGR